MDNYDRIIKKIEKAAIPFDSVEEQIGSALKVVLKYVESGIITAYESNSEGIMMTFANGIMYVFQGNSTDE